MCTITLRAGLALWVSSLVLSWTAPGLADALSRAERPEVRVGDATVYQDLDVRTGEKRDTAFVVRTVDADKIVGETSLSTSGTRTFTRDWNLVEIKTGERVSYSATPFLPHLQFPLEVGRKWDTPFEVEVTAAAKRNAKWKWQARVVATEAVTVAGGTFQAFKIEYDGSFATRQGNQSWTGAHNETAWFAPEPGLIVKRDYEQSAPARNFLEHHVVQLLSYKPVPQAGP